MKLNIDTEWLRMMAAKEQNKILSAGGLVLQMAREAVPAIDLDAWSELFPLKAMRKLRFSLPDNLNDINALLSFFGVRSPEEWTAGWAATSVAFRQTSVVDVREEAVAAWVREAEIIAGRIPVEDFDADQLISSIDQLRRERIQVSPFDNHFEGDERTNRQIEDRRKGLWLMKRFPIKQHQKPRRRIDLRRPNRSVIQWPSI